jgi:glutaredoxin
MKNVTIYSKDYCPFCKGAKQILNTKGISFTEIDVEFDEINRQEMISRSGRLAAFSYGTTFRQKIELNAEYFESKKVTARAPRTKGRGQPPN